MKRLIKYGHATNCRWLLAVCVFTGIIHASEVRAVTPETETDLGTFMVTATRSVAPIEKIGRSTEVITRKQIEASPATDLYEVLEYVSGVDIQRRNGATQADVSIRGGGFEQTLILLDGISMSNPQTGHHNMNIPLQLRDIERIEVVKGPGAHIYGANAMAGVINIITRKPESPGMQLHMEAGEHDYYNAGGSGTFATRSWKHRLSAAQRYSSGFDPDEPTGFNIKSINTHSKGNIGSADLEIGGGYIDKDFGASRFYFDSPNQKENTETLTGYASMDEYAGNWHFNPHLSYQRHEDAYSYAAGGQWYTNESTTDKLITQFSADTQTSYGTSTMGIGAEWEEIESSSLGDHDRSQRNLFFNQRIPLGERVEVGAGLSAVYYSEWGWEYWPGLDINLALSSKWSWFASFGESFRIPTYTEMYYNTPMNVGNAALEPEEAQTWETGIRGSWQGISTSFALFQRESDNLIEWVRSSVEEPWHVANIADTTTTGVETEVGLQNPFGNTSAVKQINFAYTYLDTDMRSDNLETKYALNHLRHQLQVRTELNWTAAVQQQVTYRYEKRLQGDSSSIVDTRLKWKLNPALTFHVTITNIFDSEYIEAGFAPAPGRWVKGGISWRI
ncbi:MAG: TonB-dependent receptor [Desulfuromonadaceae bacterium]